MSRIAPAIRHRRRLLDQLALALQAELIRSAALTEAAAALSARHGQERQAPVIEPISRDAWFSAARATLRRLAMERRDADHLLGRLRREVGDARARLALLEVAEMDIRAAERRTKEKAAQVAIDERSARSGRGW